ncbi:DUF732 domain-containing protein [Mycobacterium servetii]|uniref:DUF732 domain-containing protein n=1 Tax=Mycobacterium servetii TaxID=3237418 RepID=A0ABV4BZ70_9MYCO
MTTTRSRSRMRALSVGAAGAGLMALMVGQGVASAPHASAGCTLSAQDEQYINLLAQDKLIHGTDFNDCHMVAEGRWFAQQVRTASDPLATAKSLVKMVDDGTPAKEDQAEFEVEAAIYTYAPDMVPKIKDEFAHQPPPPEAAQ